MNLIFRDKNRLCWPSESQTLHSVEAMRTVPAPIAFMAKAAKVLLMGILAASLTMPAVRPALAQGDTQGMIPLNIPKAKSTTSAPAGAPVKSGLPLPPPTDIAPPLLPLPPQLRLGKQAIISGALDFRRVTLSHDGSSGTWLREGELNILYPIVFGGQTRANAVVQGIYEDGGPNFPKRRVSLGETYIAYRVPSSEDTESTAYIKLGQFQIPFGLLAVYDPHLDIIQPLYSQALGLRLDWGAGVSGRFYSVLNYDLAVTAGVGPNHVALAHNKVTTVRLGRTFVTRNGTVNVGGSLLSGRLPITDINEEHPFTDDLPPSGRPVDDRGYIQKTRIAGDATMQYSNIIARGEVVTGADGDQKVLGYFLQGEYHTSTRLTAVLARSFYQYPLGDSKYSRNAMGLVYSIDPKATVRAVYEFLSDKPSDEPNERRERFTVQLLLRF